MIPTINRQYTDHRAKPKLNLEPTGFGQNKKGQIVQSLNGQKPNVMRTQVMPAATQPMGKPQPTMKQGAPVPSQLATAANSTLSPTAKPALPNAPSFAPSVAPQNNLQPLANQRTELANAMMAKPVEREQSLQPQGMNNFQQFNDAAYGQMKSRLDDRFETEQKSFDQQMVNQGLVPGTEAYDSALKNFNQGKNDAYDSAKYSAMQFALNAQGQDFGQRAQSRGFDLQDKYSSLSNALSQSGLNEQSRQFNAGFGFNQDQANFNNNMSLSNFNEGNRRFDTQYNNGLSQQDFGNKMNLFNTGEGVRRFDQQFSEDSRRWNNQNDFNQFLAMDGVNRAYNDQAYRDTVFNASREDLQYNRLVSALMGGMPQQGAQPLDVMGAYNSNANTAMGQYNAQMQQANANRAGFNSLLGTAGMGFAIMNPFGWGAAASGAAAASSRNYKENGTSVDKHEMLDVVNNLDVERWNYKGEERTHIGAYAEDFNTAIGNNHEADKISYTDAIGVLMGSVQALTERVEELEGAA